MGFMEAVQSVVIKRFADFQGRSARSEYWYFVLFNFLVQFVLGLIGQGSENAGNILGVIIGLALLIPGIAVTIRRFHDLDKSGW